MPNESFQRTRATKRLGVFGFRGVARGAERGRSPEISGYLDTLSDQNKLLFTVVMILERR